MVGLRRHSATSAHRAAYQQEFVAKLVLPRQHFDSLLGGRNRPGSSQKVVGRGRKGGLTLAKLSISIPDDLDQLLDEKSKADKIPVSHIVTEALRAYFALPSDTAEEPASPTPPHSSEEIRQLQEYLWDLYQSYERTRSSVLVLYHRAEQSAEGELLGIPPESSFKKPPWPKPRPKPASP